MNRTKGSGVQSETIEQISTASLIPYARNARTHSEQQVSQIAGSIQEFGFCNPVLIDAENGIIAGHGRVLAAQLLKLESVPCLRLSHLTDAQKRAYDHPIANTTRPRLWNLIRECTGLDWQLLTKRPHRIVDNLPDDRGPDGWPHVWLGTSVEDMRVAERVDHLRNIPAVVRFISYEPAIGPLDDLDISGIDWIIYGGESGPGHRPEDKNWARVMHAKCSENGTAFFHKQSAGWRTELGIELDGKIVREYPTPRVVVMV